MGISLLGPLRVDGGGSVEPRDRITLSVLAVRRGQVVSRDEISEALWGNAPPASWPKQVQICIARLRKALGPAAIETAAGGYRLAVADDEIDAHRFEQLIGRGRTLLASGEPDRAAPAYARALSLWRGRPFDELDSWLPGRSESVRLEELRRTAEEDLLEARLAAGEHRAVAADAEALACDEPLRERRWATLALAQYRCGRQGEALRTLAHARHLLAEQLGVDPGEDLSELEVAILRQDPALSAPPPPAVSESCPYKGLAPYDVEDMEGFFGRDTEVAACLARLRATPLLVVAGSSGCGKSSLVRAGLVPALRRQGHTTALITPGPDAEAALVDAVTSGGGSPVVVVDQFEALFASEQSTSEVVRRFCGQIADYAQRAPVVIAVRSDHLGGLGADPAVSRLVERGLHLVSPLAGDALREAIEQPAALAGLRLEPGLVELLVRDCEGEPGALPLLSHALAETWRRRDGPVLTVEGYRATGGIRGAVARSADRLHDSLPREQREILRSVLLRLVAPSLEGDPVRRRMPARSLLGDPDRDRVVSLLVRSRLVTAEEDSFEVAHEALARAWPRLRSWLDEDAAGQRILRHLGTAADGWEALGRPDSELYRGARLDAALEWCDATRPNLTELETAFLDASVAQAASESRALAERARRDARQNRRLRGLVAGIAGALVLALVGGAVAVRQRAQADEQRERAEQESRVAAARELAAAANANIDVDPERSILLALAAVDRTRSADGTVLPEAEQALHRATVSSLVELRVPGVGGSVDWSPDGDIFVTEGPEDSGIVDLRDARTGASVKSWDGHDIDVNDVAFNHDGTMLATTGDDGAARIWDPRTGWVLHTVEGNAGPVRGPAFSQQGSLFAAVWMNEGVVRVLDLATGQVVQEIHSVAEPGSVSFDPTGARLAVSSFFEPLSAAVVVEVATGDHLLTLEGHEHAVTQVAWSPDGRSIATSGFDASTRIFDAGTGHERFAILGGRSHANDLAWSPDSNRIATAGAGGVANVFDLSRGGPLEVASLSAHDSREGMWGVAFSPDGSRVLTGNISVTAAMVWDVSVTGSAEVANVPTVMLFYPSANFTPDGQRLLATGADGSVTVWDGTAFTGVRTIETRPAASVSGPPEVPPGARPVGVIETDVGGLDVSRDGRLVAAVHIGGAIDVLDVETGAEAFTVPANGRVFRPVTWSPDGRHLAVADQDDDRHTVRVLDLQGHQVAIVRDEPGHGIGSVAFAPDGDHLVTTRVPDDSAAGTGQVVTWDWRTGAVEDSLDTDAQLAVPSPTGDLIATADGQDAAVWSTATGERVVELEGHTSPVLDLAFSPGGSRLATSSADGTVRLWDPLTGDHLVLRGHIGLVSSLSFNANGAYLASAGADGTVRVWALDLDNLIEIAESKVTRSLTDDECRQYLHVSRCPQT